MTQRSSQGFTIIELTLAMSFVALLLISVAMLSIQLTNLYSRGLTLKEMAQSGTEASNDIRRTMSQAQLQNGGVLTKTINGGGTVLCTGTYSYVANSKENLQNETNPNIIRVGTSSATATPARLVKVRDSGSALCGDAHPINTAAGKVYIATDVSELLSSGSRQLLVRQLTATPTGVTFDGGGNPVGDFAEDYKQGRGIYTVTMVIGTGVESEIASDQCLPPSETESNLDFCAIDKFEFTVRAGSSSN